ncbi:MAG: hypothetical protein WCG25_07610 [bacterium]
MAIFVYSRFLGKKFSTAFIFSFAGLKYIIWFMVQVNKFSVLYNHSSNLIFVHVYSNHIGTTNMYFLFILSVLKLSII